MSDQTHPRTLMADFDRQMAAADSSDDVTRVLERWLHEDYVRHDAMGRLDRAEWIRTYTELLLAFPDLFTANVITLAEDDWLAHKWSATGQHTATYFGVPPTRRRVNAAGITLTRFSDGRILEEHSSWSKADVMHALAIIPISALG
ncbi:hypothetical protein Rhow_008528 [Rhodococcus wratislaviensis]|uniref:Ester cyclase n=1 Tax=Rhodococcus wratislaviensis TaxID=44752 RepID=A0A402CKQ3_RHOWR|nr:ester cyclase [Rhodococcus wratislaviensis]GCE44230.1 hypothetical protein Rhow_008528 [Rhodococcus wratislaviensis]